MGARKAIVNPKAIYAAGGGIAAVAIAIFFILGSGNIRLPGEQDGNQTSQQLMLKPELSVRNVTVVRTDNESASVQITFEMYNPNPNPLLLESLQYTLIVDGFRMTGGDIGGSPEGIVSSSADLTQIPSEMSVPLRNIQIATRNSLNAESWDSMVEGTARYEATGFYAYRTTARLETTSGEEKFALTFP